MAVKIRLKRLGKIRNPQYRIVVADARTKRDGRAIEEIGKYHPKEDPSFIEVNSERAQYWLGVGAQPSEPVLHLLKLTGDWQRFNGDPNPENKVKAPAPRADRRAAYEQAAKEAANADTGSAGAQAGGKSKAAEKTQAAEKTEAQPAADAAGTEA